MARGRHHRDPAAPKRNLSAYLLYQNAMRDTFKTEHPELSFGELSKYTSKKYSQLTPEQKTTWRETADADKQRFLAEMQTYVPSAGYDNQGSIISHYPHITGSKKKQRDPTAPKRNLSAYLLYQNAMRDQFKGDNPGMTFGQLSKYTSHMYKSLTPEEKAQWEERAQRDKVRFEEEMKHYNPPNGFDAQGNLLAEFAVPRKNSKKNAKDPNMPKRARGSYLLFTKDERPKIQLEDPCLKFTDMGAVLGERWRNLSEEDRKKYDGLAEQDKLRFAHEMDIYKQQLVDNEKFFLQQQQQIQQEQQQTDSHQQQMQHQQDMYCAQEKQEYKQAAVPSPHNGYDIYQHQLQDDANQHYLQDQQHHQVMYQHHPTTIIHPDQFYHQQIAAPIPTIGNEIVYKTDDGHQLIGHEQVLVYEQMPAAQMHYEDVDIYKTDHDIHQPGAYYAP